jgi:hypothetical protein
LERGERQRQEGKKEHSSWEERAKSGYGVREGEQGALKVLLRGAPLKLSRTAPFGASIRSSSGSVPLAVVVEAAAIGAAGVSFTVGGSGLVAGGVAGPRGG